MLDDLDSNTLTVVIGLASGIGAVVSAVVSGFFALWRERKGRKAEQDIRESERNIADQRIAEDREHSLKMIQVQFAAQRDEAIHQMGREAASELVALVGEVESSWRRDHPWALLIADGDAAWKARRHAFRIPDADVAEIVVNGIEIIQHAWIGAKSNEMEDCDEMQRKEMRRMQDTLRRYIAGESPAKEMVLEQREITSQIDEIYKEYWASQMD